MFEFLQSYAPEIASVSSILVVMAPFLRQRMVSDRNLTNVFNNIKETATRVNLKEIDIVATIDKVNGTVDKLQKDFVDQQKKIQETILAFTDDELYSKMLLGLSQLDELNQLMLQKDDTIERLMVEIKEIKKKL